MTPASDIETSAAVVVEGLYDWFKAHPWFVQEDLERADLTAEAAAQEALLSLARGRIDDYRRLPAGVRTLALRLQLDFLAKLMGPMAARTWPISPAAFGGDKQRLAWAVVEHEIARSSSGPGSQH